MVVGLQNDEINNKDTRGREQEDGEGEGGVGERDWVKWYASLWIERCYNIDLKRRGMGQEDNGRWGKKRREAVVVGLQSAEMKKKGTRERDKGVWGRGKG